MAYSDCQVLKVASPCRRGSNIRLMNILLNFDDWSKYCWLSADKICWIRHIISYFRSIIYILLFLLGITSRNLCVCDVDDLGNTLRPLLDFSCSWGDIINSICEHVFFLITVIFFNEREYRFSCILTWIMLFFARERLRIFVFFNL